MFELGYIFYFLVVFGQGGLVVLAAVVYFVREFLVRLDRPSWSARSRRSKAASVGIGFLALLVVSVWLQMFWITRAEAVPGAYKAGGVWGNATLNLRNDGTFDETWQFKNEYSGKAEGAGSSNGRWHDKGRDWLTRDITLDPFTPLAEYGRGHEPYPISAIVAGYGGVTSIEVDQGADISFFK